MVIRFKFSLFLVLVFFSGGVFPQSLLYSSEFDLKRKGGGELYGSWVSVNQANYIVSTREELQNALAQASAGQIVYVSDNAEIDLTGYWDLDIPSGVTLASGRGQDGALGGLLFTDEMSKRGLFNLGDRSDIRITGLRFKGPFAGIETDDCGNRDADGIRVMSSSSVEIDNNEFFAWPFSGIKINSSRAIDIHHNHIHHNRRSERTEGCRFYGLGYGVVTDTSQDVTIRHNLFHHNRHDIASAGSIDEWTEYEAAYNLVLGGANSHSFDVHGGDDKDHRDDHNAGHYFLYHHNIFYNPNYTAVKVRGIPIKGAWVFDNVFSHHDKEFAVRQHYVTGNLTVGKDEVGVAKPNVYGEKVPGYWSISYSGDQYWEWRRFEDEDFNNFGWGDFDGDGATDALLANGSDWFTSPKAKGDLTKLVSSSVTKDKLRFGDFNGDGKTDVFRASGEGWYVVWSGKGTWNRIGTSSTTVDSLSFADFDGDGITDIVHNSKGTWSVSWSGTSGWKTLNTNMPDFSDSVIGDFNGDGIADVLKADGTYWWVSLSGQDPWIKWGISKITVDRMKLADFDGDGTSDIFIVSNSDWLVSFSGKSGWEKINASSVSIQDLVIKDFNGDGKADVLTKF
ncbi:VCBS repeat-containing protein [Microbulbifer sp. MLAF003]|uniref:FG-GAP repeat domain-containing protein n=1 Tax=Microbulbifer sp. MLAF003 TaxID=3032582 RepID=UPI0024AE48BF|nr:VCBS repeat-containing protein [Microbulbifer sp. MLAF003]WHI50463.1 VCBS repeat-containing protein [Microbulbifer sp. MLAF003]